MDRLNYLRHLIILIFFVANNSIYLKTSFGRSVSAITATLTLQAALSNQYSSDSTSDMEPKIKSFFENSLEEIDKIHLSAQGGQIPSYVNGALLRNGPALFGAINENLRNRRSYTHIFDGLAKLSRYEVLNGEVYFSSKFMKSNMYKQVVEYKRNLPPTITTAPVIPRFSFFQRIWSLFSGLTTFDNVPVNVHQIGDNSGPWVAVTDAPVMLEFDPITLDTKKKVKFSSSILPFGSIELFSTAHPHKRTSAHGNTYTYNYVLEYSPIPSGKTIAHIVRIDAALNRLIVGSIELRDGLIPYVHDFSVTGNYSILCIWPLAIDMASMSNGEGFLSQLKWSGDAGNPTRIYVFDVGQFDDVPTETRGTMKETDPKSPIAVFEAPGIFAYHHINAYEEAASDGRTEIVMDVTGYADAKIVNGAHGFAYLHNVKDPELRKLQERDGTCYRFRLPMPSKKWSPDDLPIKIDVTKLLARDQNGKVYTSELVRINSKFEGKPYRYSYGFTGFAGAEAFKEWALVKQDHVTSAVCPNEASDVSADAGTTSAWIWSERDCFPSEPVFVADPHGKYEDDGVLLSQVYDASREETFLLVVNASDMKEICRYYTGHRVPISFHGQFMSMI